MGSSAASTLCVVCNEAVEAHTEAICSSCGETYHLNQRNDIPGKDCGEVWINEEHLGLEFACNTCLHPEEANGLDDILELAEAAEVSGLSEGTLESAVTAGSLRARRLGSGTLIFQRRDILAYVSREK